MVFTINGAADLGRKVREKIPVLKHFSRKPGRDE
jgi:hypothetical protein